MCGIVGFVKLDKANKGTIDFDAFKDAFKEAEKRGNGAAGFYSPATGVIKDGTTPTLFVGEQEKKIKKALNSIMLIGHARAASKDPRGEAPYTHNGNNHPHESKDYILIHNGYFEYLPRIKGYQYHGTCDSERALAFIQTFGVEEAIKMFSKSDGFALVIVHKPTQTVYFYRNTNPIIFSYDVQTGNLIFGSTSDTVLSMSTTFSEYNLGLSGALETASMVENHLVTIGMDGKLVVGPKVDHAYVALGIKNLSKDKQDMMELVGFFAEESRYLGVGAVSRHVCSTGYMGRTSERVISQTPNSLGIQVGAAFSTIRNGILIFHAPLKYLNDTTLTS